MENNADTCKTNSEKKAKMLMRVFCFAEAPVSASQPSALLRLCIRKNKRTKYFCSELKPTRTGPKPLILQATINAILLL